MKNLKQILTELGYLKEDAPGPTGVSSKDRFGGIDYGIDKTKDYFGTALDKLKRNIKGFRKETEGLTNIRITYTERSKKFYSLTYTYKTAGQIKSKRLSQYARAKAFLESERERVPGGPILNIKTSLPKIYDEKVVNKILDTIESKSSDLQTSVDFIDAELSVNEITKKEALEAINNDFLQFVTSLGGTHEVQSDNTNVVIIDFKENYGEEAEFEYNLVTKSLHPAGISRPEDDKASALYDTLWKEKAKIFRKYIEMEKSGKISEFRRTGRQYKAQGQGGSAGNRRPGIMRGPDIEDRDDEEYTSKGDPNIDKGDFYDYSPYGFTIRFLGYEDGDDVIVRGNGFFSEKVKNGKVTFKSYPMKDAQGNRLEDAQGNRPGTPNSAYKLSDNYDKSNIEDVLGNDHPFVVMTKSNHWKNNHSIDIDDNSISITLDTPNNLPRGLAPHAKRESKEKQKIREFIRKSIKKLI